MSDAPDALSAEARPDDPLTLGALARELPGASVVGDASARILGVHHDSRRVRRGDLFVARRGEKSDGRAFIPSAIAAGAAAIMVERGGDVPDAPVLLVDDVPSAMALAAAAVYGHPAFSLDVVGVTGTNGKTTTTHLVRAAIDGALGKPACGIIGTIGHKYGDRTIEASHTTPESDELARVLAVMKKRGASHVAMEVSSIALVLQRVKAVRFRVAAFTNLTQDHLDFHGSMEQYAAAKMDLFTTMAPGLAVVNVDDPFGAKVAAAARCRVLRVRTSPLSGGSSGGADVFPERVEATSSGMRLRVRVPTGVVEVTTRLVGLHNVENLLVTLGIVSALELDVQGAAAALADEIGAPGRLERCDGPGDDVVVLVDYAHTPDALARVLDAVKAVAKGRVVCVFGCGGDRDPTKRGPMGAAVGARADVAIVTSDNPRTEDPAAIARPVEEAVAAAGLGRADSASTSRGYLVELDRKRAIELAIAGAASGDVILVAGKGHEDYQIVGATKRAFDDRVEARAALATRRERQPAGPREPTGPRGREAG